MNRNISPSLLSANFTRLREDIEIVEKLGVDRLHLDVMDGHFVPNLTFGPFIISQIREITDLHLETHLMIEKPHEYIEKYAQAGSDTIIVHYEASKDIRLDIQTIKSCNKLAGIAINPDTDYKLLDPYLDDLDYILIMSVFPGFGGQKFIESTLEAMRYLSDKSREYGFKIGVDGGVNLSTIDKVYETGIDITIVGSALYGASDIKQRYLQLINEE